MSTENFQKEQTSERNISEPISNPINPPLEENPNPSEIKTILPDSIDNVKNMFQPLNDKISKIDEIFESAEKVPSKEEIKIITEEIPTTKTITTTTTVIKTITTNKDGKESTTKEIVTNVDENKEKINNGSKITKEIIINNNKDQDENKEEIIIKCEDDKNNLNINEINDQLKSNITASKITFGAPEKINYNSCLTDSNVTFGVNNSAINQNQNNINNSNISDSADKSSEQGINITIETKNENEDGKNKDENNVKISFGFKQIPEEKNDKKEIDIIPKKENEIKLVEDIVKFGYVENTDKENKDNKKNEIEIEPGEIQEEEKIEIVEEKKEENKDENKDKKDEIKEDKIPIFTKNLFDNSSTENKGNSSIFEQKLFNNETNNQNKIEDNNINFFPDKKIDSIFENKDNAQEIFLKNNTSLIPQSKNTITTTTIITNTIPVNNTTSQNSEIPSAVFGAQNNQEENPKPQQTLNDIIKEGTIYNAESSKKTQSNPNIFININTNISNENSNTNNNPLPIQVTSLNKPKNPFKIEDPKLFNINQNINNNIDSNDNLDTNESSINRININMVNNDKKISSPFAELGKTNNNWLDNKVNEIHVNPIFTSQGNPFNSLLDNKQKNEEGEVNSSLFPGLKLINSKSSQSAVFPNEKKIKSNPVFPNTSNDFNVNKPKSNLFVSEKNEIKDDEKNNNEEKGNNIQFSDIISVGIPKFEESQNQNMNPFKEKEIVESIINENSSNLNPDNNLKDKNIDINNENNKLTELNSLIISKENNINLENKENNKEDIKEKENIPESQNPEIKKEEIIIQENININNTLEKKENEIPKDSELIMSDILDSNMVNPNEKKDKKEGEEKAKESLKCDKSVFSDIENNNKKQEESNPKRKSLFGDLFQKQNEEKYNIENLFAEKNKSAGFLSGNNEKLFPDENNNNISQQQQNQNIFSNNKGQSLFNHDNQKLECYGDQITPIKSIHNSKEDKKENEDNKKNNESNINNNTKEKSENDICIDNEKENIEISIDIKAENGENKEDQKKQEENEQIKEEEINKGVNEDNKKDNKESINIIQSNNDNNNNDEVNIINNNISNNNQDIYLDNKPETNFAEEESESEEALSDEEKEIIIESKSLNANEIKEEQNRLDKKSYSEFIQKIYRITEKKNNKINEPEDKEVTICDNSLNKFLTEFEDKIKKLKKCYIITIIKEKLEKDKNKKIKILFKAELPKKRNEIKKIYNQMIDLINKKPEKEIKKHYYILILDLLKKYNDINDKEIQEASESYKNNLKIQKNIKNANKNAKYKKIKKIETNEKKSRFSFGNIIPLLIPLAFAGYFVITHFKDFN